MVETVNCPKCDGVLHPEDDRYALIYTCEPCGIQVLDYKTKIKGGCMEIVLEVLDEIADIVTSLREPLGVEVFTFYLWKSRARGDCREDSDIDIWMEVSDSEADRVDELNRQLVENPLPWHEHEGKRVVWDFRFSVGVPASPYYSYQSLRKLRARHRSS